MTLRAGPLEHDATLPDGRSVHVRVGLPEDGYIRPKDIETVTVELYGDGEHLAAVNTILDPDQVDAATHLLRRIVARPRERRARTYRRRDRAARG